MGAINCKSVSVETAGELVDTNLTTPVKWVAIVKAKGEVTLKGPQTDLLTNLRAPASLPMTPSPHGLFKVTSTLVEDVVLMFGDTESDMPLFTGGYTQGGTAFENMDATGITPQTVEPANNWANLEIYVGAITTSITVSKLYGVDTTVGSFAPAQVFNPDGSEVAGGVITAGGPYIVRVMGTSQIKFTPVGFFDLAGNFTNASF